MQNSVKNNVEPTGKTSNLHKIYLPIVLVLLVVVIGLLIDRTRLSNQKQTVVVQLEETTKEKNELNNELTQLYDQYESLKTNNDTLNAQLQKQQDRIKQLMDEVKNLKSSNYYTVQQYKTEIETMREIMRDFVYKIDSLNTLNQSLVAKVSRVEGDFRKVKDEKDQLTSLKDSLAGKVQLASQIKMSSIRAAGLKRNDDETAKTRRVDKIMTCFTINENTIAQKGTRDVYIRVAMPDGKVLSNSAETFKYQGKDLAFSAKRNINYDGQNQQVCIYWLRPDQVELVDGRYAVDIFMDGVKMGETSVEFK